MPNPRSGGGGERVKKYKYILNRFFPAPDPKYGIIFLPMLNIFAWGGAEKYKYILNRFFRAPNPKNGIKKFLDPPQKKKFWERAS